MNKAGVKPRHFLETNMHPRMEDLEADLNYIEGQTHVSPYVAFMKIKKALAHYSFFLEAEDSFIRLDPNEDYYFELNPPGDEVEEYSDYPPNEGEEIPNEERIFLTVEFYEKEAFYGVELNIVTEEDLDGFIGEDEIEEI